MNYLLKYKLQCIGFCAVPQGLKLHELCGFNVGVYIIIYDVRSLNFSKVIKYKARVELAWTAIFSYRKLKYMYIIRKRVLLPFSLTYCCVGVRDYYYNYRMVGLGRTDVVKLEKSANESFFGMNVCVCFAINTWYTTRIA